jgi:hypothetical protein
MYDTFEVIHVIAAVAWVGGGIFHVFASGQLAAAPPATLGHWAAVGEQAGRVYYAPAAVVTLLAGIGMVVVGDLSWGEPIVSVGFAGVAASILLGAVLTERASKDLAAAVEDGAGSERLTALRRRIRTYSVLDVAILLVVVAVMVVRPG